MAIIDKKKKILSLISLYVIENSGIRGISAILRAHGFKVNEIYFKDWTNNRLIPSTGQEVERLIQILRDTNTDIVGLSVRASGFMGIAENLTRRIREALHKPIIWGGMHPTFVPEECVTIADIVCVGEAEFVMLELMERLSNGEDISSIENLWMRKDDKIIRNALRPLTQDLDALPFRDFYSDDKYFINKSKVLRGDPYQKEPVYQIMCSRGCPFATCSYCSNSVLKKVYQGRGRFFRYRSVSNVIEELKIAKARFRNLKRIRFDDEVFLFNKDWLEEFSQKYKGEIGLPFECLIEPRTVEHKTLKRLKGSGLGQVYMGIQNIARINCEFYGRKVSDEQVLESAETIHNLNLRVAYQIILDDPFSVESDKEGLFELLMKLPRPFDLYLFSLTHYPKSELTENLLNKGLISENDIEGKAQKIFIQYRVDLNFPRPKLDLFWTSLIVLASKEFIPKGLILRLAKSKFLKGRPGILKYTAQTANLIKMVLAVYRLIIRREISLPMIKRWLNFESLITA